MSGAAEPPRATSLSMGASGIPAGRTQIVCLERNPPWKRMMLSWSEVVISRSSRCTSSTSSWWRELLGGETKAVAHGVPVGGRGARG